MLFPTCLELDEHPLVRNVPRHGVVVVAGDPLEGSLRRVHGPPVRREAGAVVAPELLDERKGGGPTTRNMRPLRDDIEKISDIG